MLRTSELQVIKFQVCREFLLMNFKNLKNLMNLLVRSMRGSLAPKMIGAKKSTEDGKLVRSTSELQVIKFQVCREFLLMNFTT